MSRYNFELTDALPMVINDIVFDYYKPCRHELHAGIRSFNRATLLDWEYSSPENIRLRKVEEDFWTNEIDILEQTRIREAAEEAAEEAYFESLFEGDI